MQFVTLHDRHPLWAILRMAVLMAFACVILNITATKFDGGELTAAGGVGVASIAFDLIKRALAERS